MKSLLKKLLLGDTRIEEYATVTITDKITESVFFEAGKFSADISETHWVLCLEPIMLGIWMAKSVHPVTITAETKCRVIFCDGKIKNVAMAKKKVVAIGTLAYFDKIEDDDGALYLFKVAKSRIYHVGFFKTTVLYFKYYKKPKWPFAKYKRLIAAYSFPRRVRVISFKQDDYFNIFPMDLLGQVPYTNKYVFGLRHTNVTLARIIEEQKIVVSEVPYVYKNEIYELGKHHGRNPPAQGSLPFKLKQTDNFKFPIPEWIESYKEIRILQTKNLGSHMLLWGEVAHDKTLQPSRGNLYHVHFLLHYHQTLKKAAYPLV